MKSQKIGKGNACPKCRRLMIRYGHKPSWRPRQDQPYWFEYWDRCKRCRHFQHYEVAKRFRDGDEDLINQSLDASAMIDLRDRGLLN